MLATGGGPAYLLKGGHGEPIPDDLILSLDLLRALAGNQRRLRPLDQEALGSSVLLNDYSCPLLGVCLQL